MTENPNKRKTPPDEGEWPYVWEGLEFSHMVKGIITSLIKSMLNWRFLAIFTGLVVGLNMERAGAVVQAVIQAWGAGQ